MRTTVSICLTYLAFIVFMLLTYARLSHASGPAVLTFTQPGDCSLVDHWDAFAAAGTVQPDPTGGLKIGTIANSGGTQCAGSASVTSTEPVVGVGTMTFWIVAVAANGTVSAPSNGLQYSVPFQSPVLVNVHG